MKFRKLIPFVMTALVLGACATDKTVESGAESSARATTTSSTSSAAQATTTPAAPPPVETTTTEQELPIAVLDDYCTPPGAVGLTTDGYTAYCVRVQYTDAYVWSSSNELVPVNPNIEVEPAEPSAIIGDYCSSSGSIATTADGSTAYCVRVQYTDAYVWSLSNQLVPKDPNSPPAPSAGDDCFNPDAMTADANGQSIYCNPTVNGRNAGNLVWQLQP